MKKMVKVKKVEGGFGRERKSYEFINKIFIESFFLVRIKFSAYAVWCGVV